jgi:1-aminocyclopropane-1-carboxylate deaminase/D-cysteine desulfhydrase-like pyridoxal-dependent ACC family enzyme
MAEKKVSVRLVAEGGRRVRAELEGVGEAGARGFGRLSLEMEMANTRLVGFARKAGIALAAVTAAAAAAGVAMIRSGLETIGAQADMAASLKTTVESLQVLTWAGELAGVSMGEIEQATRCLIPRFDGAILSQEWKEALWDRFVTAAPRPRTPSEQQYSDRKLRSRS